MTSLYTRPGVPGNFDPQTQRTIDTKLFTIRSCSVTQEFDTKLLQALVAQDDRTKLLPLSLGRTCGPIPQGIGYPPRPSVPPRPHTLDTIAALCMSLMSGPPSKEQWKSRFFDLKGAYRQCVVNPLSACFAHIAVFDPTTKTTFAFRMIEGIAFWQCDI